MRDRRDFIKTTAGTLACLLSARGLSAWQVGGQIAAAGPPVKLAIIGLVCDALSTALLVRGARWLPTLSQRFPGYSGAVA